MKIGIITYNYYHLKTEQLVLLLQNNNKISNIEIFAIPFVKRKSRKTIFNHRPNMNLGSHVKYLSSLDKVNFQRWDLVSDISNKCDLFILAGAGIINIDFAKGKPILNCHPGIIPTTRGLDSFKWAILNNDPLGLTLHMIDNEVDKGTILYIQKTPVFKNDTLKTVARRHYEAEIYLLSKSIDLLSYRDKSKYKEKAATKRMPLNIESKMIENFRHWKKLYVS